MQVIGRCKVRSNLLGLLARGCILSFDEKLFFGFIYIWMLSPLTSLDLSSLTFRVSF